MGTLSGAALSLPCPENSTGTKRPTAVSARRQSPPPQTRRVSVPGQARRFTGQRASPPCDGSARETQGHGPRRHRTRHVVSLGGSLSHFRGGGSLRRGALPLLQQLAVRLLRRGPKTADGSGRDSGSACSIG